MFFPKENYPLGMPDDFDFPDLTIDTNYPVLLGPKGTMFGRDIVFDGNIIDATIAGLGKLYIWGWAEYNDIFENTKRHRTEFCHEVIINRIDTDNVRIEFRIYKGYNGADEQCLKEPIS
jgi:hypothetical protein